MTNVAIDFVTYGTKSSGDRSGAYLFLPDGPAEVCFYVVYKLIGLHMCILYNAIVPSS